MDNKRKESESYDDYRTRLRHEAKALKRRKSGKYLWVSRHIANDGTVHGRGTYVNGMKLPNYYG